MRLSVLIDGLDDVRCMNPLDPEIIGISMDSRTTQPGYLFVALAGSVTDGHQHLSEAISAGAAAILISSELFVSSLDSHVPILLSTNLRRTLSSISARFYEYPSHDMRMIAVTGTNGKTTTTYMIDGILRYQKICGGVIGTIGARFQGKDLPTEATTPEAPQLQKLLSEMRRSGVHAVAMEVSSHSLALHRVADIRFDVGIFTNLTQDHLDFHKTFDRYLAAKGLLFESLTSDSSCFPRIAVLNQDDASFDAIRAHVPATCHVISYGFDNRSNVHARILKLTAFGSEFEIAGRFGQHRISLPIPGQHNILNFLGAFCACCALGVDPNTAAESASELSPVPGRMERIDLGQPFLVVVDYAHSPDALINILSSLRPLVSERLICVFGCGGDRDRTKRPMMADAVARFCDKAVITSDNPRTEQPEAIIRDILPGIPDGFSADVILDRRSAIFFAIEMAQAGDAVVIAGKGHENYQIFGRIKYPFDDCEEARNALILKGFGE